MITVIFCGGSGTRLWPLSTHQNPKQLINLINDSSLLQTTYARAQKISSEVYLLPETRLIESIQSHMPEIAQDRLIIEPALRGTASCLVVALDTIARRHDRDELVCFLHSDHHIRDTEGFQRSFDLAAQLTREEGKIVLVGVEPTYPATGFEYIEKGTPVNGSGLAYSVSAFKKRPEFSVAQELISSGRYLWNAGYFIGSVNTFIEAMRQHAPVLADEFDQLQAIDEVDSDEYRRAYLGFENDSIDFALIQKVPELLVVPATFDWMDVGSFKDLHSANILDESGNYTRGDNIHLDGVDGAYVRNDENKPIAVIGLDNIVVVNTSDGILVARKDLSQNVGDIAKKIQLEE